MLSCHTSLGLLSSGVLILGSRLLSLLRLPIFFLGNMSFVVAYFSSPHHPSRAMCVFYAFVSGASISFPHLSIFRSFAIGHALIHPIFIHKILLFLGLDGFPSSEPIHVVAPIGAIFLR